ncbi:MAG TPA: Zn-dependent alcohol dehydrogenase [Chloroflexota bacterium]|jgi:NDMA-dependent alcohol dehydrogenase|nr:Zn-dependent alcohol dehydrogenase [Chloroflexota bacterium]
MPKAAILYEVHKPLEVADVAVQNPKAGEVLVRVAAAGVCHSDLHVMHGDLPANLPVVIGHEGSGVVEAVGEGVTSVAPGDHVILVWRAPCGECFYCRRKLPALCDEASKIRFTGRLNDGTSRFSRDGQEIKHFSGVSSFAERTVLPEQGVVKIRKDVPIEKAALVGCAVMTGVGAVINTAKVQAGDRVVVFGAGGVGLNIVQGAAMVGAEKIIAVDLLDNKLAYARQFGATHTLNGAKENVVEAVKELTDGLGADYAFDAIGNVKILEQGLACIRKAGALVCVGMPNHQAQLAFTVFPFILSEKRILSSIYGSADPWVDFPKLLNLYAAGKLKLDELISREYTIDQVNEAFRALEAGEVARSIVRFA